MQFTLKIETFLTVLITTGIALRVQVNVVIRFLLLKFGPLESTFRERGALPKAAVLLASAGGPPTSASASASIGTNC